MRPTTWIMIGALLGAAGVTLGAFGAHGLPSWLQAQQLADSEIVKRREWFDTAVRYHLVHAIAIVLLGVITLRTANAAGQISGWLFLAGVAIFSGLLYAMSVTGIRWLGAIVPIGGVAMILGWLALAWAARHLADS